MARVTPRRTGRRVDVRLRCVESLLGQLSLMQHTLSEVALVDGDPRLAALRLEVERLRAAVIEIHADFSRGAQ